MNDTPLLSDACRDALRWSLVDGVGPVLFDRLVRECGGASAALGASASRLAQIRGFSAESAERIAAQRDRVLIEPELDAAARHGVRMLCAADAAYPAGLRRIPDPPIVLYVRGELRETDAVALAIVGSRRCSIYGGEQARRFGELLAGVGLTVVSGLARGIDSFAHLGALDAGGRCVAVLGCGLHEIYPPENLALAQRVAACGALLSELPMETAVRATNFPARNRIIAGMALGTLVVEAAARSGALITARLASEYNREVFAIPGRVQDASAIGVNKLIRDGGAKLVTCLEDVLDELQEVGRALAGRAAAPTAADRTAAGGVEDENGAGSDHGMTTARGDGASSSRVNEEAARRGDDAAGHPTGDDGATALPAGMALPADEAHLLALLGPDARSRDELLRSASLAPGAVLAALTSLELKGLVRRLPGQLVQRSR